MLTPFSDESLHSYVYRLLSRNGINDFRGILTANGFKSYPWMPKEYSYLLRDIHFETLYRLYRSSSRYSARGNLKDPFQDITDCRKMYFEEAKFTFIGETIPIRFCRDCIVDSIYKNGVAYFKVEWVKSDFCTEHGRYLEQIESNGHYSKLKKYLSDVYKGNFDLITDNRPVSLNYMGQSYESKELVDHVFIPPCAKSLISSKIIKHELYYSDGLERLLFSKSNRDSKYKHYFIKSSYRDSVRKNVNRILPYILENGFDEFLSLLGNDLEVVNVCSQQGHWGNFERTVIKPRDKVCGRCVLEEKIIGQCSAQGIIFLTGSVRQSVVSEGALDCEKFRRKTKSKVLKTISKKRVNRVELYVFFLH